MKRRTFLNRIRQAVLAIALAPQIAFRTPSPKFAPIPITDPLNLEEMFQLCHKLRKQRDKWPLPDREFIFVGSRKDAEAFQKLVHDLECKHFAAAPEPFQDAFKRYFP